MDHQRTEKLEDFNLPWCQVLLNSPDVELGTAKNRRPSTRSGAPNAPNSLFAETLWTDTAVRAFVHFRRPRQNEQRSHNDHPKKPKSPTGAKTPIDKATCEHLLLLSIGRGFQGHEGVAHGGAHGLLMDQVSGMAAVAAAGVVYTLRMDLKYKKPIPTPSVVLCRAYADSLDSRRVRVKGYIEDGYGSIYAEGTSIFIKPRQEKM